MGTVNLHINRQNIVPVTVEAVVATTGISCIILAFKSLGKLDQLATLEGLAANKFTLLKGTAGVALISTSVTSVAGRNMGQAVSQLEAAPQKKETPQDVRVEKKQEQPSVTLSQEELKQHKTTTGTDAETLITKLSSEELATIKAFLKKEVKKEFQMEQEKLKKTKEEEAERIRKEEERLRKLDQQENERARKRMEAIYN